MTDETDIMMSSGSPDSKPKGIMPTTQWTLIRRLQHADEKQSRAALDELCRAYHYPLYCHLRRRGLEHHDAEDVLHDFLAKLLRHESFGLANAEKGRLRTYLLSALKRFIANWKRDHERQREREISTEAMAAIAGAERRFALDEAAHHESPDRLYDKQWAHELMNRVLFRLRESYEAKGRGVFFDALRPVLVSGGSLMDHDSEALAKSLSVRPGTLRMILHRMLEDYREALRLEILKTVETQELARQELIVLMEAFEIV